MPILNAECTWDEVTGVNGYNVYLKRPDYALEFDGVDDYVDIAASTDFNFGAGDYTIRALCKIPEVPSGVEAIVSGSYVISDYGVQIYAYSDSTVRVATRTSTNNFLGIVMNCPIGSYFYVTMVKEGTELKGYVDENLINTKSGAADLDSNNGFRIGSDLDPNADNPIKATIDQVEIWGKALTQTEITNYNNTPPKGNEVGLISYYPMNEGQGSTLVDQAGSNDGTINGASWTQVGQLDYQKQNTSLIPSPQFIIDDLPIGDYEAYCTAVDNVGESDPSNIVAFSVGLTKSYDIYQSVGGEIIKRSYPSGDTTVLATFGANGLAVDPDANLIFTTHGGGSAALRELDTMNVISYFDHGWTEGAVVDRVNQLFYWSDSGPNAIYTVDYNGFESYWQGYADEHTYLVGDFSEPEVVIFASGFQNAGRGIRKFTEAGGQESVIEFGSTHPYRSMGLDRVNNHIYWAEGTTIHRINYDGTNQIDTGIPCDDYSHVFGAEDNSLWYNLDGHLYHIHPDTMRPVKVFDNVSVSRRPFDVVPV